MRIFCAIEKEPYPGNHLWHNNIVAALRDLGHDIVLFDYPELDAFYRHADTAKPDHRDWIDRRRPRLENALIAQIDQAHRSAPINLFFSYFYSAHSSPSIIEQIKSRGIKTVNWFCNASYQLDLVSAIAPAFDLCLVPEKDRMEDYRRLGANPAYCQEAANPTFYRALNLPRDLDIVFVGQNYATRAAYCQALHEQGLSVHVWGNGWRGWKEQTPSLRGLARAIKREFEIMRGAPHLPRQANHGFCSDEEMVCIYNRAKIVLGFGAVASLDAKTRPIYQVRLRDFEAPMCGAFYLTEHQEELSEFFKIGQEIETFRDPGELTEKARFYLSHPEARDKVRLAGYARAQRDHTWQKRLSQALAPLL